MRLLHSFSRSLACFFRSPEKNNPSSDMMSFIRMPNIIKDIFDMSRQFADKRRSRRTGARDRLRCLFEIARFFVRFGFDHVASIIVNANYGIR
jgi:hypothetical protein